MLINAKPYAHHAAPLHEVGALLEARAMHPGRSARNHLLSLASWGSYIAAYLPTGAGQSFSTNLAAPHALSPWTGLAVMVAWVVGGFTVAGLLLRRRDA